ncbi:response regulator transcription factor [Undibacterium oligocarboniphilum]|uniref:Response regulator transcription factor n=1 Tax=Undibacterium oligocarboniphilum TaxID=666702 RepID=A0A850QIA3_9BURK|nr:response regulator transcription factor [Undibacterium oligocarboniphilum]MBC3869153.1 response regulator transcription factor [Undibacterium oligocarboniphilum]NVO77133.1 response regulator transcription factor [Undibacterium oligocarboniphilum]
MEKKKKIHLLLIDDHPLVRDGLRARLESVHHFHIAGEAGNATEALKIIASQMIDLILMDINLGSMNGIHLTGKLTQDYPDIAIIMLSMHDKAEYVTQAIQAGARAYVLKDAPAEDIINAIETVTAGGNYFSSGLKQSNTTATPLLTQREQCILNSIATGKSNKHIAHELGLSVRTVETHRLNIKRKLNIEGQADLIRYALNNTVS